ncbi:MAG: A/G-specific adenine glycosylase, partial [Puniceicoccales bacterium]|nr:A/G-specific adenine glycosylase [Puniceicoccales bacterium]
MTTPPAAEKLVARAPAFQQALGAWFEARQRRLPWRDAPALYKTVVSEFMLQQTQVDTVLPYFTRWLARWPDFAALAAATEDEVIKAWEGLGYYNRARNLLKLAARVAALPEPPRTAAAWLALPGVGPYTAAAIASIACAEPVAVVDGNVVRVLARLTADERLFRDNGTAVKTFAPLAQSLINPARAGAHNQAMMELGALVCSRAKPLCATCPVADFCAAAAQGAPERLPRFVPRVVEKVFLKRLWLVHAERLLLYRHPPTARRLRGLHELPLAPMLAVALTDAQIIAKKRRTISNQQIEETIYRIRWTPALEERIG